MKAKELANQASLPPDELRSLADAILRHETLEDVLIWCAEQTPPTTIEDVVVQDEFSHDVLIPLPKSLYLVYGTT